MINDAPGEDIRAVSIGYDVTSCWNEAGCARQLSWQRHIFHEDKSAPAEQYKLIQLDAFDYFAICPCLFDPWSSPLIDTANTLISSTKCNRFSQQKKARNFLSKELVVISQIQVETLLDRHLAYCDAQFCGHPDVGLRPWPQATGWADSGNIREVFSADSPSGVSRL